MTKRYYIIILIIIILTFTANLFAKEPTDINNHWAQDYILSLINNEIMETYPDGTFKPDQLITRGEFSIALAKQMNLLPDYNTKFKDLEGYSGFNLVNSLVAKNIINGYPDGTFKPDKPISKVEIVSIMMQALGINDNKVTINLDNYQSFQDVPKSHWAFNHIQIARKMNLITEEKEEIFNPNKYITRAEAARYLTQLAHLSNNTGYITDVYPTSQKVSINLIDGTRKVYNLNSSTLIGRNNRLVSIDKILKTDRVFLISDNQEELRYIKAYGMITQEDIATEISSMTNGVLDNNDVSNLANGNISILKPKLQNAVKDQLLKQGLSLEEVDAIMSTNWNGLEMLSKERLSEAIAIQTGLPLDITRSLLTGDWDKIKSYAQIELVQRMVQEVLNSDLIS